MTEQEAKIILLENALRQACNKVDFLHNCLINPSNGKMDGGYSYEYPENTLETLKYWETLIEPWSGCYHSAYNEDCKKCVKSRKNYQKLMEATSVLEQGV